MKSITLLPLITLSMLGVFAPRIEASSSQLVEAKGGLVKIQRLDHDETGWGERMTYVEPFKVEAEATSAFDVSPCMDKKGRLPSADELIFALQSALVKPAQDIEATSSSLNLPESAQLEEAEGVGTFDLSVQAGSKLLMKLPSASSAKPSGRCLFPVANQARYRKVRVSKNLFLRKGPGKEWALFETGAGKSKTKSTLKKGTWIEVIHREGNWSLVRETVVPTGYPDTGAWVKTSDL